MMSSELIVSDSPDLSAIASLITSGLQPSRAEAIKNTFLPMSEMLASFESAYSEVVVEAEAGITEEVTKRARRLRIDIGKVRIAAEKARKAEKEEYLRAGKAIDGVANVLKWAVSEKEDRLKDIEGHLEIMEKKRLEALQEARASELSTFVDDAYERNLSGMEPDVWSAYLTAKKQEYLDRVSAVRKIEEERIAKEKAEAEERERIRKENERLKAEAEANAKREAEERQKREAEERARLKKEAEERAEIEGRERAAREEAERLRRAEEERARREKEEAERVKALEKNRKHKAEVKSKVADALVEVGATAVIARAIVEAIGKNKIPCLKINYNEAQSNG